MSTVRAKGKHPMGRLGAVGGKEMFSQSPGAEQRKLPEWPRRLPAGRPQKGASWLLGRGC